MSANQQLLMSYKQASSATYATWNPSDKNANIALSSGNLVATASNTSWKSVRATIGKSSWKRYREVTLTWWALWTAMVWVGRSTSSLNTYCGADQFSRSFYSYQNKNDPANWYRNNTNISYWWMNWDFNLWDVIWVALNMDWWSLTFYVNGVSRWTFPYSPSWTVYPMISLYYTWMTCTANFGATAFTHSPPSWFTWLYS